MDKVGDPIDVLGYEIRLSEMMESIDGFSEDYDQYAKSRQSNSGGERPQRTSSHQLGTEHPILVQIYNTREAINEFFRTDRLKFNNQVQDTITIGKALSGLEDTSIVKPDGTRVDLDFEDVFVERLWKEEDYWDTVFELEIASSLEESGFNPKLVDEQQQEGPDVILEDDDSEVWLECKRKRPKPEPEREQEWAIKEILDQLYDSVQIDEDSLALEIRGQRLLTRDDVGPIVNVASSLVDKKKIGVASVKGSDLEVELVDYFNGMRETTIRPEWAKAVQPYVDLTQSIDLFGHLNYEVQPGHSYGHAEAQLKVSQDGKVSIANAYMLGVRCSEQIDYVNWIMEPIKKARKKLTGHEPSVILVDVPLPKIKEMQEHKTIDHKGNEVTLLERLDQRIIGQLSNSDSISAIVITSNESVVTDNGYSQRRQVNCTENLYPGTKLSDELLDFLNGK
ncbi:hypothetical protein [Haloferax sp. DFSO60]|uniref:hypothetical protein n=1 Tax=Haloferax sp. DFSO60 TaxID=3388652 RepID=UPI00397D9498